MSGFTLFCPETSHSNTLGCRYWSDIAGLRRESARLANCTQEHVVLVFRGAILTKENFSLITLMNRSSEMLIVTTSEQPVTDLASLCRQYSSPLHFFCDLHSRHQPFVDQSPQVLSALLGSNIHGSRGQTVDVPVLHHAIIRRCPPKLVAALLAGGMPILDSRGTSALHHALALGQFDHCRVLLEADSKEALRPTPSGESTLHLAQHYELAKMLLELEPHLISVANSAGQSALEKLLTLPAAKDDSACELCRLLLRAGARVPQPLPEGLGELVQALLEEARNGSVSMAVPVEPWTEVQHPATDQTGWGALPHAVIAHSVHSLKQAMALGTVCRGWHAATWALVKIMVPSVSWAHLRSLMPRAKRMSRASYDPDLRVSRVSFQSEVAQLAQVPVTESEDVRRRAEEHGCNPSKQLKDHRGRALGLPGCWDVDEQISPCGSGECLSRLAAAVRQSLPMHGSAQQNCHFLGSPGRELQAQVVLTAHSFLRQGFVPSVLHKSKYVPPDVWCGDTYEHWVFSFAKEGEAPYTIALHHMVGDEDGVCF